MDISKKNKNKKIYLMMGALLPLSVASTAMVVSCGWFGQQDNSKIDENGFRVDDPKLRPNTPGISVSNVNPSSQIKEFEKIKSYHDLIDYNDNYLPSPLKTLLYRFKKKINLSKEKSIVLDKFNIYSISNSEYGENEKKEIKEEILKDFGIYHHDLNAYGYDIIIKDRFALSKIKNNPNPANPVNPANPANPVKYNLNVLVQLTKKKYEDGKDVPEEIFGADFYVEISNFVITDNNDFLGKFSQRIPSSFSKLNEIIGKSLQKKEEDVSLLTNDLEDFEKLMNKVKKDGGWETLTSSNFSAFEWKLRQILAMENGEFSPDKNILDMIIIKEQEPWNQSFQEPWNQSFSDKLESMGLFFGFNQRDNSISIQAKSFNFNGDWKFTKEVKELVTEIQNVWKNINQENINNSQYEDENKYQFRKKLFEINNNNKLFEIYDKLLNLWISSTLRRSSQPIYWLKSNEIEISQEPAIKDEFVIWKSNVKRLLDTDLAEFWNPNKSIREKYRKEFDSILRLEGELLKGWQSSKVELSKIDLNNNVITYLYNESSSLGDTSNKSVLSNNVPFYIESRKVLSKQEGLYGQLKVKDVWDYSMTNVYDDFKLSIPSAKDKILNPKIRKQIQFSVKIIDDTNQQEQINDGRFVSDGKFLVEKSTGKLVKFFDPRDYDPSESEKIELVIPSEIKGVEIVQIGDNVFENVKNILSIKLPKNLRQIGKESFKNISFYHDATQNNDPNNDPNANVVKSERKIIIPPKVEFIGESAFWNKNDKEHNKCNIEILEFEEHNDDSWIYIGKSAFKGNSIKSVILPNKSQYQDDSFDQNVQITIKGVIVQPSPQAFQRRRIIKN